LGIPLLLQHLQTSLHLSSTFFSPCLRLLLEVDRLSLEFNFWLWDFVLRSRSDKRFLVIALPITLYFINHTVIMLELTGILSSPLSNRSTQEPIFRELYRHEQRHGTQEFPDA